MTTLPPIVVLLGGPSAEHDVSVVSGTAIAEALAAAGATVEQQLIGLYGGWRQLPAGHPPGDRTGAEFTDPMARGAIRPQTPGSPIDRLPPAHAPPAAYAFP